MKSAADRGRIGAWAYEARADADLSVEEVAERLARLGQPVRPATIRGIEGGSKQPSRRLLRAMATVYGKSVPTEPMPTPDDGTTPAGVGAYLERIDALVELVEKLLARLPTPTEPLLQEPVLTQKESLLLDSAHARHERERTQPRPEADRSADTGRSPRGRSAS